MANEAHNAAHLSFIQTQIARPLTVFLPTVYRHIPREYVDRFFATGELRLSCFAQFKTHKNEFQGDRQEGRTMVGINDKEADRSFFTFNLTGHNAFVLSTTVRTTGDMDEVFGDASIEIFEPIGFAAEAANEIPGCVSVMLGWCIYVQDRILISDQRGPQLDQLKDDKEPDKVSLEKVMAQAQKISGPKELFLKSIKHEPEAEFRFIWETNRPVDEPVIVKIQNPERFCRLGRVREG